jgi:hypothetical protein
MAHKQRLLDRKVAARAILGDLYLTEGLLLGVLKYQQWPMALDLARPLDTWQEFRGAFAASVTGTEWGEVDNVFRVLHQLALAASLGDDTIGPAQPMAEGLLSTVKKAQEIVGHHAADSEGEIKELEEVLWDSTSEPPS